MDADLKPLAEQVIVVTGASSGVGLATALSAARQGAKVVLAARSGATLAAVVAQIVASGGEAIAVVADVSDRASVERIAAEAVDRFGRIDTWVNNAGIGVYGRLDEVGDEDSRRVFDTNFWGTVNGSLAALPYLRRSGGALVNVGSELSELAVPLQGIYASSKHAVKGFTDALRMELEADDAPVSVTLIQPTAVDTPFPEHAGNYMSQEPKLPTPMIEVEKVAYAILDAATDPVRDVKVGTMAVLDTLVARFLPSLVDVAGRVQMGRQQRDEPPRTRTGTLYSAGECGRIRGRGDDNAADMRQAKQSNVRRSTAAAERSPG